MTYIWSVSSNGNVDERPEVDAFDVGAEIAKARGASRNLRIASVLCFYPGLAVCLIAIAMYLIGDLTGSDAMYIIFILGLASMGTGLAFYASSWNLRLACARLEHQVRQ